MRPCSAAARGALRLTLGAGRFERHQVGLGLVDLLAQGRQVGFERARALGQDVALLARFGHLFARGRRTASVRSRALVLALAGERLAALELGAQIVAARIARMRRDAGELVQLGRRPMLAASRLARAACCASSSSVRACSRRWVASARARSAAPSSPSSVRTWRRQSAKAEPSAASASGRSLPGASSRPSSDRTAQAGASAAEAPVEAAERFPGGGIVGDDERAQ